MERNTINCARNALLMNVISETGYHRKTNTQVRRRPLLYNNFALDRCLKNFSVLSYCLNYIFPRFIIYLQV